MIEHAPWMGSEYQLGLCGQRVAIVGWSHWGEWDEGDVGTIECISKVLSGEWRIAFFTKIRNYFGYDSHAIFWPRVMFFNYLPNLVGGAKERFGPGTPDQRDAAKERFTRLLNGMLPQKVLVFTSRKWAFPTMNDCQNFTAEFPQFRKCTFAVDSSHPLNIFFLRHPQGANGPAMKRAVQYVLNAPPQRSDRL